MADFTTTKGAGDALKKKYEELDGSNYESKYAGDIAAAVDRIKNAGDFKYDSTTDAGYQAAKSQYEKSAKKNMKNTLAASTALTGGYTNSWGQTAAQQAFDDTMSEAIARLLPQYEAQAYSRHRDGISDNYNQLNMLQGLDATDYGRYADKIAADQAILNLAASMYDSNRGMDHQKERDAVADAQWRETFDHTVAMDEAAAVAAQTKADADYYEALAEGDPIFYEYAGAVMGEDTYGVPIRTGTRFYYDGKEKKYDLGVNPYTNTTNPDVNNGTFKNGYQPDNVAGRKLKKTGMTTDEFGKEQNIWKTVEYTRRGDIVKYYVWDGKHNEYVEVEV